MTEDDSYSWPGHHHLDSTGCSTQCRQVPTAVYDQPMAETDMITHSLGPNLMPSYDDNLRLPPAAAAACTLTAGAPEDSTARRLFPCAICFCQR